MKKPLKFGRYDYASFSAFAAYAASSLIIPMVLYLLANDMKFPLQDGGLGLGGLLQIGRSIAMVITMLCCGFIAAKIGKAMTLGLGLLCMALGILFSGFATGYIFLLIMLTVAGFGEGAVEGIATPFIQDQHEDDEPGRYINFSHGFWSVGTLIVVLIAGWLLTLGVHWRKLVIGVGTLALLTSLMFLLPDRKGKLKPGKQGESFHDVWCHTVKIFRDKRFWLFFAAIFFAGGGEFCLTFWIASYIKLILPGASMFTAGLGTACFAAGMILGRLGPGYLVRQHQIPDMLLLVGCAATIFCLPFPFLNSPIWCFLLLFLMGIATGPFWPSIQSYCAEKLPYLNATMIFVLLSCSGVPGCGFFTWLMGFTGDIAGMRWSFFITPLCFLLTTLVLVVERLWKVKEIK